MFSPRALSSYFSLLCIFACKCFKWVTFLWLKTHLVKALEYLKIWSAIHLIASSYFRRCFAQFQQPLKNFPFYCYVVVLSIFDLSSRLLSVLIHLKQYFELWPYCAAKEFQACLREKRQRNRVVTQRQLLRNAGNRKITNRCSDHADAMLDTQIFFI